TRFDGFDEDFIHEPNDRCFLSLFREFGISIDFIQELDVFLLLLSHQVVDRFATDAEMSLDSLRDLLALRQNGLDCEASCGAELIERIQIERVAGRNPEGAVMALKREDRVAMDQFEWKAIEQAQIDLLLLEIDKRNPDLISQCLERGFLA